MEGSAHDYVHGEKQTTTTLEAALLASVLYYGRAALVELPDLSTNDFGLYAHRLIFEVCARLEADGIEVSLVTVGQELSRTEAFETFNYLPSDFPIRSQLLHHLRQLRRARALQRAVAHARAIASLEAEARPIDERLAEAQSFAQQIIAAGSTNNGDALISLSEIAEAEIAKLERIRSGEEKPDRLTVGIADADRLLYIEPGALVVIGGETSSGKSALCGQVAAHNARRGKPVIFVTSEMAHRQMLCRIVAALSGQPVATLINPKLAADAKLDSIYRSFADYPIFFQRSFPPRLEEARSAIRSAVARHGAKVAIIDYAQRLAELDDERREQAVAKIAHEAKNLALELGIVVVAAAQVNRAVGTRKDPRPLLSDLRESGRLEQDADCVIFTFQPERHGLRGTPELIVAKQRNGSTGVVKVSFHAETCTFGGFEPAPTGERAAGVNPKA